MPGGNCSIGTGGGGPPEAKRRGNESLISFSSSEPTVIDSAHRESQEVPLVRRMEALQGRADQQPGVSASLRTSEPVRSFESESPEDGWV